MTEYRAKVKTKTGEVQFKFKANNDGQAYQIINDKYPKSDIIKLEKNMGLTVWQEVYKQ